jgi:hypothetical protein
LIAAAKTLNGTFGQMELFRYLSIGYTGATKLAYRVFLFISQVIPPE